MRTLIIGDIHGCLRPFELLLSRMQPDPMQDRLILLGDYFDRGPDSWEVWQKLQELTAQFGDRLVLLRGNHEDIWLQEKQDLMTRLMHNRVGRRATERSFAKHDSMVEESLAWLAERIVPFWRDETLQCAHAGCRAEPLEMNDMYTLIHDHNAVFQNCYAGRLTITGHVGLSEATYFPGPDYAVMELKPDISYELPSNGVICIDTGCGKGGKLTGMIVEDGRFVLLQEKET